MKVYLSGPISGVPKNNSKEFNDSLKALLEACKNIEVDLINPLDIGEGLKIHFKEIGIKTEPLWEDYMKADIKQLLDASCVYFLQGWEKSRGATIEHFVANSLGIPCVKSKHGFRKFLEHVYKR